MIRYSSGETIMVWMVLVVALWSVTQAGAFTAGVPVGQLCPERSRAAWRWLRPARWVGLRVQILGGGDELVVDVVHQVVPVVDDIDPPYGQDWMAPLPPPGRQVPVDIQRN